MSIFVDSRPAITAVEACIHLGFLDAEFVTNEFCGLFEFVEKVSSQ